VQLSGKVAVVTGSAGGIGGAVATAFADAGAEVVELDREQADLTRPDEVAAFFAVLERLDVIFNGAGISGRSLGDGPVDECTLEAWDAVLATNLTSIFLCSKHAIPLLRAAGGGAIVNLSSVMGMMAGDEDFTTHAYQVSKGGIITLTRAMAYHYGRDGIRVNAIAPGAMITPRIPERSAEEEREMMTTVPMHRRGTTDDIAKAALFFLSDLSTYVSGQTLAVDGGFTAVGPIDYTANLPLVDVSGPGGTIGVK